MDYFTKVRAVVKIIIADLHDIADKLSILREGLKNYGDPIRRCYQHKQEQNREQKSEPISVSVCFARAPFL